MIIKDRNKTTDCPYPFVICDKSGKIVRKNKLFDRVFALRLSDSVELALNKGAVARVRALAAGGGCDFFPFDRADGFCGFFNLPSEEGFALVFIPDHLRPLFSDPDPETSKSILERIAGAECSEYKADAVMRIRSCALKALSSYSDILSDHVCLSALADAAVKRLTACSAPLGVRITGAAAESDRLIAKKEVGAVVAEMMLLFEAAYYSSDDGRIRFFSASEFDSYFFGFSSACRDDMSPFILGEEFFLQMITSKNGHGFTVRMDRGNVMRIVSIGAGPADTLKNSSCVIDVAALMRELINF